MGLDIYIYRCKICPASLTAEQWDDFLRGNDDDEDDCYRLATLSEVFYARKFYALYDYMVKEKDYHDCEYVRLDLKDVQNMLKIAVTEPNFFGDFSNVPQLCEILYNFENAENHGWHFWFMASI